MPTSIIRNIIQYVTLVDREHESHDFLQIRAMDNYLATSPGLCGELLHNHLLRQWVRIQAVKDLEP